MSLSVLEQIIEAVAAAEGTAPAELDVSLQNWVDTDAIELLVAHDSDEWMLEFRIPDHSVTVTGKDVICVDGVVEHDCS